MDNGGLSEIKQLCEPVLMLKALVQNVEQGVRLQVLRDVLEEHGVLLVGGKVTTALADELGELSGDSATEVGIVWQLFNGLTLQELAHRDDSSDELIRVDFFLTDDLAYPEVLLAEVVHDTHAHVLHPLLPSLILHELLLGH